MHISNEMYVHDAVSLLMPLRVHTVLGGYSFILPSVFGWMPHFYWPGGSLLHCSSKISDVNGELSAPTTFNLAVWHSALCYCSSHHFVTA